METSNNYMCFSILLQVSNFPIIIYIPQCDKLGGHLLNFANIMKGVGMQEVEDELLMSSKVLK